MNIIKIETRGAAQPRARAFIYVMHACRRHEFVIIFTFYNRHSIQIHTQPLKLLVICYIGENNLACKFRKKSTLLLCSTVVAARSAKNKSRPRIVVAVNYIHALHYRVGVAQPTRARTYVCIIGASLSEPHIDELNVRNLYYWGEPEQARPRGLRGFCLCCLYVHIPYILVFYFNDNACAKSLYNISLTCCVHV